MIWERVPVIYSLEQVWEKYKIIFGLKIKFLEFTARVPCSEPIMNKQINFLKEGTWEAIGKF